MTGSATTQYLYALGTRPLAQNSTAWEYLLSDALGSVRQIVDTNGNVTLAESYEPYGSVLNSSGTASSIFGYAGEQFDVATGLVFAGALHAARLGHSLGPIAWDAQGVMLTLAFKAGQSVPFEVRCDTHEGVMPPDLSCVPEVVLLCNN